MIKNISFVFQKIWQKHRGLLCYLILCVLSSLGISVVAVWFPAFVVSRISTGKADAAQLAAAGLDVRIAGAVSVVAVFAIRCLSAHYRWNLPHPNA